MNDLQIKAVLVGVTFGIWPIVISKSGLNGYVAAVLYTLVGLLVMIPFVFGHLAGPMMTRGLIIAVIAGLIGAGGMLLYTSMLSKAPAQNVGTLLVTAFMVQLAVPAIYQIFRGGQMTVTRGVGLVAAFAAAVLLNR
jgi:drug/metabolite transporter (DMT)-like permease